MTVTETDETSTVPVGMQSVDRALQVLGLLASRRSAGVSELATELGVHKSTAFRLLAALEARDLVQQDEERGRYRLGFGLVRLARRVDVRVELTDEARELVDRLARDLGESINVAVLREHYAVNVLQSRGQASVVTQNWIGQLTPLHATSSGKVLLAHLDRPARETLLARGLERLTPNTTTDPVLLERELADVVSSGHAATWGELELGLNAVAVPIRGDDGAVIAALSASGPAYRVTPERIEEIRREIGRAADDLSWRMGFWGD